MTGPVNVKKISTLNVKSGRSGKCEKKSTLNVKKKVGRLHDQSDGQFGQFGRPGQFFSGFGVSIFQKLKILGSVMIFRESVKLKKKTCEWIREIVRGFRG